VTPRICMENDRLRVNLYRLLAVLLARPPVDAILRLLEDVQPGALFENRALCHGWRDLRAAAAAFTPEQLDEEFHNLFIGLGRGEVVPYGSWYLIGHLMDKPLARLRGDLAVLEIERRPENRETEDHAAALCETMALISDPDAPAPRRQQQHFFNTHLAAWMPRFFKDLQAAPSAGFYRAVGRTGEAFMETEQIHYGMVRKMHPSTVPRQKGAV
jgi:TorA maturation chaperone TorD